MRCEVDVLICVCWLSVDIKFERSVFLPMNGDIQHGDKHISLLLHRPLDVRVTRIEKVEERLNVVIPNGCNRVIRLSVPEHDYIARG